ncbi:hypothetical protein OG875_17290 [Streptomyces sp. NBC_01498]|nr:hypothetical protein [Streptomyces sp. NBC_01498]WTL26195.1 hypothetical protein OG875_17290 [Streptomyces sp. NBC_01498]
MSMTALATAATALGLTSEQLWLLGGMALALVGAGVVALAAARGRDRG